MTCQNFFKLAMRHTLINVTIIDEEINIIHPIDPLNNEHRNVYQSRNSSLKNGLPENE
jgi:hypothetical protein